MIIPDYPEASEALDDDYLVIETRNGTCKIKKINLCHYPGARIISGRGIKVETNEDDETVISLDGYKLQQFRGDIESLSLLVANDEDSNSYKSQ
ncbi:MAG: hypothetical protein IIT65_07845 [Lachnospiraceae bacterium]|nr:hypothetical protein [Lachnospiraceae bacterium]